MHPRVVGAHPEHILLSLVGEALTPDVHEFSALVEFDSTFVASYHHAHRAGEKQVLSLSLGVGLRMERC
ncbi:MAG: hypothetical protein OD814_001469 [Candidatus Alkanophagales archaeon MCA70_species_1]|nr:hypothetical protein [Candidatus Alkanophaga volatiphilum]